MDPCRLWLTAAVSHNSGFTTVAELCLKGWISMGRSQTHSPLIPGSTRSETWPTGDWREDWTGGEQKKLWEAAWGEHTCARAYTHTHKRHVRRCAGASVCVLSVTVACKAPQMESVYQIELSVRWWLMAPMPAPLQMNIASLIESAEEGGRVREGADWLGHR